MSTQIDTSSSMSVSSDTMNSLNLEHSSLCFPKELFYAVNIINYIITSFIIICLFLINKLTFDVDSFLSHYKRDVTLEKLRDDLCVFLKVLELSMSDLINKDYPDFVNLSTNLVSILIFFFSNLIVQF
jgi:hypothetical protein